MGSDALMHMTTKGMKEVGKDFGPEALKFYLIKFKLCSVTVKLTSLQLYNRHYGSD